jgi:hypothetical protein
MLSWLRKRTAEEGAAAEDLMVKPVPVAPQVGTVPLGTYEKLADELGFEPAQLLQEQLLRFLSEQSIPVYDYRAVDRYLTRIANAEQKIWRWRPLRERDTTSCPSWAGHAKKDLAQREHYGHGGYDRGRESQTYSRAVPIHILRRVKKIQDQFGNKVGFFVSDYASPNPDPFILVTAAEVDRIIFGVWDEPGFEAEEQD